MKLEQKHIEYLDKLEEETYPIPEMIYPMQVEFDLKLSETLVLISLWVIHKSEKKDQTK